MFAKRKKKVIRQISFVLSPTWDFRLPHYLRLTNFAENALRASARNVSFFTLSQHEITNLLIFNFCVEMLKYKASSLRTSSAFPKDA